MKQLVTCYNNKRLRNSYGGVLRLGDSVAGFYADTSYPKSRIC